MGLYRRGKTWWMSLILPGSGQIRQSTRTENKKLAERIYGKMLNDVEEGRWFENQAKTRTLKEMIDRYKMEYTERKEYSWEARDRSIFKNLYAFLGENTTLREVETSIGGYEQFRRAKGAKPATIVKELGLLRRIFNVARKQWKWKMQNPISDIEMPKVNNERVRYLSEPEYISLFKALDEIPEKWLRPCVTIAIDTGLRLSNVCNLQWSEVNLFSRLIVISAEKMKNADYIGIPLTGRACSTFKALQAVKAISGYVFHDNGQRLYPKKVQRAFGKTLKAAGITNFHFHDLRHCYCSYLRQQGVDLHTIATLAGHKDLRMTKRYAHLNVDNLRDAIAKLESITNLSQSEGLNDARAV
jgi:integrase